MRGFGLDWKETKKEALNKKSLVSSKSAKHTSRLHDETRDTRHSHRYLFE